jgi:hypothetical protein
VSRGRVITALLALLALIWAVGQVAAPLAWLVGGSGLALLAFVTLEEWEERR